MSIMKESRGKNDLYMHYIAPLMNYDISRDRITTNYVTEHIECSNIKRTIDEARNAILSTGRVVVIGPDGNYSKYKVIEGLKAVKIGANGASWLFYMETGIMPDIIVTDLDGPKRLYHEAMEYEKIIALHPHGDNQYRITSLYSILEYNRIIVTSQVEEYGCTINVGGFTDGDRAIYLARSLGAKEIRVCCFSRKPVDKHKHIEGVLKKHKLELAWSLIEDLKKKGNVKLIFTS